MGMKRWLKQLVMRRYNQPGELRLPADLRLVRLYRTIRDFPGRTEADIARMIYGHPEPGLVAEDCRNLEDAGMVAREAGTGRLFAIRGLHV